MTSVESLRALVYARHGDPFQVLYAGTFHTTPHPAPGHLRIKILLSSVNPSDINIIEGVYPLRPALRSDLIPENSETPQESLYIAGAEAAGIITEIGEGIDAASSGLHVGDRVIMDELGLGCWSTHVDVEPEAVMKVPEGLSNVAGATIKVNPPTAWAMLREFVTLNPGDWVIQNGANSAVGKAVIQIAKSMGVKTINLVRNRDNIEELKGQLAALGADRVLTYDEILDKAMRKTVAEWTGGKDIQLGLNCVGGPETTAMAGYLGHDAHLVSYGAMSRSPLALPTSLFIFKNLTSHGYWQSRWYKTHSKADREAMTNEIIQLYLDGKLKEPDHDIVELRGSDEEATRLFTEAAKRLAGGGTGKKVLLTWDVPS
ncbi:mitochondrial 2-enoyl thioester reductase [Tulasnella sp. JGI-2019a]|nr:mitochondrial 2-enoyl thioester reductase [Tulasnella sp. JGI-2019a]